MKAIRLIAVADDFDTSPGLIMKGTPLTEGMMADRDGTLIAHDILEHQNGAQNIGMVWDELEALGGIWQVRGRHGDLMHRTHNIHSPTVNVASDLTRMFSEFSCDPDFGPGWQRVGTRPHLYDDDFREIIAIARHDIPCEFNDMGHGNPDEDEKGWSLELHELFEQYLTLALHRMRVGFRKAEKRFGSGYAGSGLFYTIREAVDSIVKHELEFEGQEFVLCYGNGDATCRAVWEREEY